MHIIDKNIIENYFPKSELFTSRGEIEFIVANLLVDDTPLSNLSISELRDLRNQIVKIYDDYINKDFSYMNPMMSVSSIIDSLVVSKGGYV